MKYDHASDGSLVHDKMFRTKFMQFDQLGTMRIGLEVDVFLPFGQWCGMGMKPSKKMEML